MWWDKAGFKVVGGGGETGFKGGGGAGGGNDGGVRSADGGGGPQAEAGSVCVWPSRTQTVLTNVLLIRWLNYSCKNNVDISLKIAVCQILLASLGPRPLLSNSSSRAPQPTPKTHTHTHTHAHTHTHTQVKTQARIHEHAHTHFLVHMFPCSLKSQASQKLLNSLRPYLFKILEIPSDVCGFKLQFVYHLLYSHTEKNISGVKKKKMG